ncbi:MAG: hypothetical protein ACYTHJ_16865 [Planctomycetota bacterium]
MKLSGVGKMVLALAMALPLVAAESTHGSPRRTLSESGGQRSDKGRSVARNGGLCDSDEDCFDNNACTADICFDSVCINKPIPGCETECELDNECDDGILCTMDVCVEMLCEAQPIEGCCETASECNDGNGCTTDECEQNQCVNTPLEDCIPCDPELTCAPIEVVFVMDTTGSMVDEAQALCQFITTTVEEMSQQGIQVTPHFLGITEVPPLGFECLTGDVISLLGTSVPGGQDGGCTFPEGVAPEESWGPATAIVADLFEWTPGATRIVVPVSDEGACHGSIPGGCNDPGDDRDAVTNAIEVAAAAGVMVSPIAGTESDGCVTGLTADLAAGTGGTSHVTTIPSADIDEILESILTSGCLAGGEQCEDENACTDDTCNELGQCANEPNYDEATECCNPLTGEIQIIDDVDPCTIDECDPETGQVQHPRSEPGTPCSDNDDCTENDACDGDGMCVGELIDCDDGVGCTADACVDSVCINLPSNDECDNGNDCDGVETCDLMLDCQPGEPVECDDMIDCTVDSCDPETGECTYDPMDSSCDDGNECNGLEFCDPVFGCQEREPVDCDDGIPCTVDSCDEEAGECVNMPDDTLCDNQVFCDGMETCDAQEGCIDGPDPACDDGVECTTDACDVQTDACTYTPDDSACNNGTYCDGEETCDPLEGCLPGTPPECDDGIDCTLDMCNEQGDDCTHIPLNDLCDNGVYCDGAEVCDPVEGCLAGPMRDCDDANLCTDDSCDEDSGACLHTPNYDTASYCCNPATGEIAPLSDDDPCTDDVCDMLTGEVSHPFAEAGTMCDDGQDCTGPDACDGEGNCVGDDINGQPCQSDEDCLAGTCDTGIGECLCARELCLDVVPSQELDLGCLAADTPFIVNVSVEFGPQVIAGGQFVIPYDPTFLDLVDIEPGNVFDPESPFAMEIFRDVDEEAGLIIYSVGMIPGQVATQGPAIMATMSFTPVAACVDTELCFLSENPLNTLLTDDTGGRVPFVPCCTGDFFLNDGPPEINCPESVVVNPDPGSLNATVEWAPKLAIDGCDDDPLFECTATHSMGVDIDHLIEAGGVFPAGLSEFECLATDSCGGTTTCAWSVEVSEANTIEVSVQLSPTIVPGPLLRCIEFELYSNCLELPVVVTQDLNFGLPFDLPGRAKDVQFPAPAGQYFCMTARDPLHTIRATAEVNQIDGIYTAIFKGDPAVGGNWLVSGNLDGSNVIDVYDVMIYMDAELSQLDPNTPCGTEGAHADINGDGIVDTLDYSFIQANYMAEDKITCCGGETTAAAPNSGVYEVSVKELRAMGLGHLAIADLNNDGLVNDVDIDLYMDGVRPQRHGRYKRRGN